MTIIAPLFIGFLFGFMLHKGGMTRYHKIVNCFRFTDLAVLKFMMSSLIVGSIGIYALVNLGLVPNLPITATHVVRNIFGGLLFGIGMAGAGICAAPVAAGSGEGRLDYLIPGIFGMLTGALLFGLTYQSVYLQINKLATEARIVIPDAIDVNAWLVIGLFTAVTLLILYVMERVMILRRDKTAV
jgi:uncharacterized protein